MMLTHLRIWKIIVRLEGRIQRRYQIEQRFARNCVAQNGTFVARIAARRIVAHHGGGVWRHIVQRLGRRKGLQIVRSNAAGFGGEALVEVLLGADHFARIALDASHDGAVAGRYRQGIVDGLELAALEEFHDDGFEWIVFNAK